MTTNTRRFAGSEVYDQAYYGDGIAPKANYVNYGPHSHPHWAQPLAEFIREFGYGGPVLDVGCAYGHLVREIEKFGIPAFGIEWSKYAWERRVNINVERADARALPFEKGTFSTIVSLDLLEHFPPANTIKVIEEMVRVSKRKALFVHVIGAYFPEDDIDAHMSDPTHANHEPLQWYIDQFEQRGVMLDEMCTAILREDPAFSNTDWSRRIVALWRPG